MKNKFETKKMFFFVMIFFLKTKILDFVEIFPSCFSLGIFDKILDFCLQNIVSPRKKKFFHLKFVFHKYIVFSFPTHPSRLESDQNNGYCKAGKFKTPRKSKILWFFGIDLHISKIWEIVLQERNLRVQPISLTNVQELQEILLLLATVGSLDEVCGHWILCQVPVMGR